MAIDMTKFGELDEGLVKAFAVARRRNVHPDDAPYFFLAYCTIARVKGVPDVEKGLDYLERLGMKLVPPNPGTAKQFFTKWFHEAKVAFEEKDDAEFVEGELEHSKRALDKIWPEWRAPRKARG